MIESKASFHETICKYKSLKEIQSSFTNLNMFISFKKELIANVLKLYPQYNEAEVKRIFFSKQVQKQKPAVDVENFFQKFVKMFKLQQELQRALMNKVEVKRQLLKQKQQKVIPKEPTSNRDPRQIYVRLTTYNQTSFKFMVKNKKFPRFQMRLTRDYSLKQVIDILKRRWIGYNKIEQYDLYLYPYLADGSIYEESLNKFLLMTDILYAFNWEQANVMEFKYQIVEKNHKQEFILIDKREEQQSQDANIINKLQEQKKRNRKIIQESSEELVFPNNIFSLNQNSLDLSQNPFSLGNSLDFNFIHHQSNNRSYNIFRQSSMRQKNRKLSGFPAQEPIRNAIQQISLLIQEQDNSFKPPSNIGAVVMVPKIRRNTKNK